MMKDQINQLHAVLLENWNVFAAARGYPPIKKLNYKIKNKLQIRMRCDPDYLKNILSQWELIHKNCEKNEWGDTLDLFQFLRSTTYVMALAREPKI